MHVDAQKQMDVDDQEDEDKELDQALGLNRFYNSPSQLDQALGLNPTEVKTEDIIDTYFQHANMVGEDGNG